jgi:hypothetical protein
MFPYCFVHGKMKKGKKKAPHVLLQHRHTQQNLETWNANKTDPSVEQ